ncbi:hypothetical protein [Fodinibius sp. Rm-B-1B1-1]|uniref:hypothetical protein n=1 Tax=Fodinibius alkaliphilus TaxID=3140241 RepID=UPI00315A5331
MDNEKLLQKYLDGELSGEEEREALHIIAEDPEMRELITFERKMRSVVSNWDEDESVAVPEGFTDQVMHSIEQADESEKSKNRLRSFKKWLQSWWIPQPITWRPVYGVAMFVVLVFALIVPMYLGMPIEDQQESERYGESIQQVSQTEDRVWVRFVYIDENAQSVEVAGDFNGWNPIPLDKQEVNGEKVWTGLIAMKRGEHRYMFVKDGEQWVTDPMAPVQRDDGFGNKNAVIYL